MLRNKLKDWKSRIGTLEDPKVRPNDFQQLVLGCMSRGLNAQDATRIFGISEWTVHAWEEKYGNVDTDKDVPYFMRRARALGADDETLATWFGYDRPDKVAMILAEE